MTHTIRERPPTVKMDITAQCCGYQPMQSAEREPGADVRAARCSIPRRLIVPDAVTRRTPGHRLCVCAGCLFERPMGLLARAETVNLSWYRLQSRGSLVTGGDRSGGRVAARAGHHPLLDVKSVKHSETLMTRRHN